MLHDRTKTMFGMRVNTRYTNTTRGTSSNMLHDRTKIILMCSCQLGTRLLEIIFVHIINHQRKESTLISENKRWLTRDDLSYSLFPCHFLYSVLCRFQTVKLTLICQVDGTHMIIIQVNSIVCMVAHKPVSRFVSLLCRRISLRLGWRERLYPFHFCLS